jgi:hypothetical protein
MMTDIRMPRLAAKFSLALGVAVACVSVSAAQAQVAPVRYWIPGGLFGFGGAAADGQSAPTYGDVPSFDADLRRSGFLFNSYSVPTSSFAGGLGWNGIAGAGALGNFSSLSVEGTQFGYAFKGAGGLPVTLFGGVDTLKYNPDVFGALTSSGTSSAAGYTAHAGVEIRPTSNLSLSFSAGYAQPGERVDSDIRSSLLPGESPMFAGGRR